MSESQDHTMTSSSQYATASRDEDAATAAADTPREETVLKRVQEDDVAPSELKEGHIVKIPPKGTADY